ncbi:MAG: hypothetical protein HN337_00805 [Deltaproteobacteria bacterium]|jgi:hypothetical protein|nr:hypothetical protein [Deltaproteobacteria bacterium]
MTAKIFRQTFLIIAIILLFGCGGATRSANPVVDVNTVDGSTDVAVDSIFTYTFADYMNADSVKTSSFFIVVIDAEDEVDAMEIEAGKADYDSTICNPDNKIEAEVKNPILKAFTVYPSYDLLHDTQYAICVTTDVEYFTSGNFEGFTAYFTTELLN